jgi:hypothetical protein
MQTTLDSCRGLIPLLLLALALAVPSRVLAKPPDLTVAGMIATLKTNLASSPVYGETYNLGPTGLRGWIYVSSGDVGADGLITGESRQILVTVVGSGTPAAGVLAVDDVIFGVDWGAGTNSVPLFASDARKSLGTAIGEAEKTANRGLLRIKRWRAGDTNAVSITLPVMGSYTAVSKGVPSFRFSAAKGCMYRLDYKNLLTDANWSYGGWRTNTTGGDLPMTLTDAMAAGQPHRLYRLEAAFP